MKFKTIKEGEKTVIYNYRGEGRVVDGPQQIFLFRERLYVMKRYTANAYQLLVITSKDGIITHKPGPCEEYFDEMLYSDIQVKSSILLDANHMIIVYKKKNKNVARRIIQGPTNFMIEAEEWLHQFRWHGPNVDHPETGKMSAGANEFTQLAIIPDQFYYNVTDVRTTDDTMITVKLMLFYELSDVIMMIDVTNDPMADLINAVCADVIAFAGKLTYEEFLRKTSTLSQLTSYPQLLQRAKRIGYDILKVVYRGYHASSQLQIMQCHAIESRTQLRLNAELQEQTQRLTDFKLHKEQARTKLRQKMQTSKQQHEQKVAEMKQKHRLELQQLEHDHTLTVNSIDTQARLDQRTEENIKRVEYLEKLNCLGVDVTKYLIGQQDAPINEEIQIVKTTE